MPRQPTLYYASLHALVTSQSALQGGATIAENHRKYAKTNSPERFSLWSFSARYLPLLLTGLICALLSACVGHETESEQTLLTTARWQQHELAGDTFQHSFFVAQLPPDIASLHVYIGGDGRAFLNPNTIAQDPTPRAHLTLRLALVDPAPSAFLARPCYYGGSMSAACTADLWTVNRYSPVVIDSMLAALSLISKRFPRAEITLVGYSGGGVIALLMARKFDRVVRVLTVAAPLDTDIWVAEHGYTPLAAISNPAGIVDWPPDLEQIHLSGAKDSNVTPEMLESYLEKTGNTGTAARSLVYPGFDHKCCWLQDWPQILRGTGLN